MLSAQDATFLLMPHKATIVNVDAEQLLGEWHPLVEQLGSSEGILPLASASEMLSLPRVTNRASLTAFLETYKTQILIPVELPAILQAFSHADRHETRELIRFDQSLKQKMLMREFATASQRVGCNQLRRLRPLRDHRLVQRYLAAVEEKRACGWHTLVFGVTLSIYSLPVRQGLVFYERQTLRGFIDTAANVLRLSLRESRQLLDQLLSDLPHDLDWMPEAGGWVTA